MNLYQQSINQLNRRSFLNGVSVGVGSLALTSLLEPRGLAKQASPLDSGGAVTVSYTHLTLPTSDLV